MGFFDSKRIAYAPPDRGKLVKKIMDWLESNQLSAVMEDSAALRLADDFMVGWEITDEHERQQLGLMAVKGQCDFETLGEFKQLSLMRGVEQWDMMISCARAQREIHADGDSLEGQDILTYLTKIMAPTAAHSVQNGAEGLSKQTQSYRAMQHDQATQYSNTSGLHEKRKRQNESHYFEKTAPEDDAEVLRKNLAKKAKKAAKRIEKKKNRQSRRAQQKVQSEDQSAAAPAESTAAIPVLQEAAVWYRSNDNSGPSETGNARHVGRSRSRTRKDGAQDGQESMSGVKGLSEAPIVEQATDPRSNSPGSDEIAGNAILDEAQVALTTALEEGHPITEVAEGQKQVLLPEYKLLQDSTNGGTTEEANAPIDEVTEDRRYSLRSASKTPTKKEHVATSKYFAATTKPSPSKPKSPRPPRGTVSALPFPTLSAPRFGLIQEKLADDPFRLMIAISFLVRTHGRVSIPVFFELMERYPTPQALVDAVPEEVAAMIKHLGLSVVRTAQIQKYARIWVEHPPNREVRHGVKNYPNRGDGSEVRSGEKLPPEDQDTRASAWEIGHMTQGPYAIDSWRVFCRDVLLGRAQDWKGKGREPEFQPEWMRVLPLDKELRAYLRWMWMREGWDWDPKTGEKEPLSEELRKAVNEGRVQWDNTGSLQITRATSDIADEFKDENGR